MELFVKWSGPPVDVEITGVEEPLTTIEESAGGRGDGLTVPLLALDVVDEGLEGTRLEITGAEPREEGATVS